MDRIDIAGLILDVKANNDPANPGTKDVFSVTTASGKKIYVEGASSNIGNATTIDVEDQDISSLIDILDANGNGNIDPVESQSVKVTRIDGVHLIDNHAFRSQVTQKYEASGVRFKWNSPKKGVFGLRAGTLDFTDDIVSVGTDNSGKILTFICPRVTQATKSLFGVSLAFSGEVEIGEVAGKIDPVTGIGTIYLDNVNFNFWGTVNTKSFTKNTIQKVFQTDPATQPVLSSNSQSSMIVLENIPPGAHAGQDFSKTFSSYLVQASVGAKPKQSLVQNLMLASINNITHPGLLDQGTALQWNIDLKAVFAVNGL